MQSKFAIPVVVLSVLGAIAFAAQWTVEQRRVYQLTIATGNPDGEYYAFASALSNVVAAHEPKIQIRVLETEGSQQNATLLAQKETDLGIIQGDTALDPSVQAIAYLFPEICHLIAAPSASIQQFTDLKGKRVAIPPVGSGSYAIFRHFQAHYNLQDSDFRPLPMTTSESYAALEAGQIDALFRVIALGSPSIRGLLQRTQAQLVPIDQAESMRLTLPVLEASEIPKGTYDGALPIPDKDIPAVGLRAILVTRRDLEPAIAKVITQTLFEFRNELVSQYPRATLMRLPDARENLGLSLHPGARNYYNQDEPAFLVEYAEVMGFLLSFAVLLASSLWQFRRWLDERQKNRADMYNLKVLALLEQVEQAKTPEELESLRQTLFEMFQKVVTDLDTDRISQASFQSFTFPWDVALSTIRHRELLMSRAMDYKDQKPEVRR
ncbi:TAXI family TRAP transporter solute-binding subunit [Leptolyngbya sp. O-77]|uniref:TAXI family TRAP transporter solute-binding subunit n=1 Tax=Leptolyngbya sp. O-77 TaxID=1080068 RepID=UPI00074D39F9|nr:TAXI family TRAP transporter solute-binding subunit [Leptolyngbya sp. O-77]BAU42270.1 NMT1/THI5 like protein [Leptolyngbya sp. O-77]